MEMEEVRQQQQPPVPESNIPAIATQCFMLSNMFDPTQENEPGWDLDVRDVSRNCNQQQQLTLTTRHFSMYQMSAQNS